MPAPARRRSVFADRLLEFPDRVFSDGREFQHRGRWREHFALAGGNASAPEERRLIFEIGCHDAGLLAKVATKHPTTAFVGIDWTPRVLHAAAQRVAGANLRNVALLHGRAQDIRRFFTDGELDEVWIFHPEPLDTPRELPNRLLAERFLLDVHAVLKENGSVVLKTDHAGYFDAVLELLTRMNDRFEAKLVSRNFWGDSTAQSAARGRAFAGEMTAFEARFVRKRKPIYFAEIGRR